MGPAELAGWLARREGTIGSSILKALQAPEARSVGSILINWMYFRNVKALGEDCLYTQTRRTSCIHKRGDNPECVIHRNSFVNYLRTAFGFQSHSLGLRFNVRFSLNDSESVAFSFTRYIYFA